MTTALNKQQEVDDFNSLYTVTGDVKDINTLLVPLAWLRSHLSDAQKKEGEAKPVLWVARAKCDSEDTIVGELSVEDISEEQFELHNPDVWECIPLYTTPPAAAQAVRTDRSQPWTVEHLRNYPSEAVAILNERLAAQPQADSAVNAGAVKRTKVERTCPRCKTHAYHWGNAQGVRNRIECVNCGHGWTGRITKDEQS